MSETNSWATVALRMGWVGVSFKLSSHGLGSCLERLPSFKSQSACDDVLRVAELEARVQHLMVIEVPKSSAAFDANGPTATLAAKIAVMHNAIFPFMVW
jgi:hypothetical protein